ncbi:MAG: tetratricopeptide repeat protein [Proteobacteria bacterium]|nr:tetratricopeptide repeat protein [Pseudomonadota bacterium]
MLNTHVKPTIEQTIQAVMPQIKALDAVFAAYRSAHSFDPYDDVQTLFGLVNAELQKPTELIDSSLLIEFLVFHREKIKQSLVDHIYKILARDYENANESVKSYGSTDVLGVSSGEVNYIESKMKEALAIGEDEARKVREHLMEAMLTSEIKAELLVGIGDVYLIRYNRESAALACYQEALAENPEFEDAAERILAVSEHLADWKAALAALDTLKVVQSEYLVSYLCKEAWIYGKMQGQHERAVEIYQSILDKDTQYLDVFVKLIQELQAIQDYNGIKKRFVAMMERGKTDKKMNAAERVAYELGLGKICLQNLRSIPAAIRVYHSASSLVPDSIQIHEILAKLHEAEGEVDKALEEYHEMVFINPNNQDVLLELAREYRSLGRFDESLCCYRVLDMQGCQDEECKSIVARFGDLGLPEIHEKLSDELWQFMIPKTLDGHLVRLLKLCAKIAGDLFANEFSTYRVHPKKDLLDMSAGTTINRVLRNETGALGFAEVPFLYRCDQFSGVTNAYFIDRSFLIHSNCLKGRSSQELAFMTAKALMLMRPEYYLLQQGVANVELIIRAICRTIRPYLDIELDKNQEQVARKLDKDITDAQRAALGDIIDEMQERTPHYNTQLYFESAEEFANRVGLLFCDDPSVVGAMLAEEAKPISVRSAQERLNSLIIWATSEQYFKLRKKLNIALQA